MHLNNNNMEFAPVVIPTLNRYSHLKRLVESLKACNNANNTDLIIGLDYPPSDRYVEGWNDIKKYIGSVSGFREVILLESDRNLGVLGNIEALRQYVYNHGYNGIITIEDDNEVSPNFLDFMNFGIKECSKNSNIIAVCGYNYDFDDIRYDNNFYYSKDFSAWGWGTCIENHKKIKDSIISFDYIKETLTISNIIKAIYTKRIDLLRAIFYSCRKKVLLGDVFISWYLLVNNSKYCIFPALTKVRNWGHDGTGLDCGNIKEDVFRDQKIDMQRTFHAITDNVKVEELPNYKNIRHSYKKKIINAYK